MNKTILRVFYFILFLAKINPLLANFHSSLEFRSAAFFHSSERFREIYSTVTGDYQLEGCTQISNCIDGWANFDWMSQHGKSKGFNDPTWVSITNLSLGIKVPYYVSDKLTAYIGIGPSLSRIWLRNKSQCGSERVFKWAMGCVLKSGFNYFINEHVFIDLFLDYLYQPVHFETRLDIGGVKAGVGLGIRF